MAENKAEILNPKTDWVFKLMFSKGEEGNKALISFLNAFLKETYGTIRKADILNTELTRESPKGETYYLDLLVKTDNGLIVNIEMQQFWSSSFLRRKQLYLARTASRFLKKEPKNDDLLYAISLTVFGCDVPENAKLAEISGETIMQFIYVALNELIGYTMSKDIADYTAKDCWIRFLSNYAQDKQSGMLKKLCALEEGLEMAEATLFKVTEEERRIARELSEQYYYDTLADERAEGREEGEAIGLEKGLFQGARQKALETAKNLLDMGLSLENIVKATGLTREEIEKL
ncbi:Rpn family recombination-promoting nuclease/putative transposase [Treponema sp. OMZ 840]|uniref:Rpn family recombination-promoting nuclease/putative transposase n=1 Tax=Treponema sp. OMZ 840 TaxID=244313 RepID=UPI003D8DBE29